MYRSYGESKVIQATYPEHQHYGSGEHTLCDP